MAQMPDLNVVCKNCGNEVSPYITECPYCGNRLRKRAPKIERDGTVSEPRKARKARKPAAPRLSRFRSGEIPGIRGELTRAPVRDAGARRPLAVRLPAALPGLRWSTSASRGRSTASGGAWRPRPSCTRASGTSWPRSPPSRSSAGCWSAATGRSWSLGLFVLCGMGGIALAVAVDPTPLAIGGNGAALGLLCAWAVPDLIARSRGEDYDGDLLGHGGLRRGAAAHAAGGRSTRARSPASRAARRVCWSAWCWLARASPDRFGLDARPAIQRRGGRRRGRGAGRPRALRPRPGDRHPRGAGAAARAQRGAGRGRLVRRRPRGAAQPGGVDRGPRGAPAR